jgi:hypothetical protein
MKPGMTQSSETKPKRNSGGSKSFSGMSLVAGHSNRMGAVFPRGIQRNDEQWQAALLDRLGIVLPKRMRFAEHERPALAASA